MKKTGMMLTFFLILTAMLLQAPLAGAATDGVYQLTEVSQPVWDGTTASRTIVPTADYDYTYGDEASVTYTLPWAFTFYGQSYSSITADTNGNVWFSEKAGKKRDRFILKAEKKEKARQVYFIEQ